ncbi:MAG: glycoside hydrolase [Clostridia bacterium]|nr:glycoside hydrolase [Clostridia bacterium]
MGKAVFNQVFSSATGNADNYRIPSAVKTKSGVIIACADERYYTAADNPNRIDKVVRRSLDGGITWQEQIVAVKEYGESKMNASAAIDPCLLYDDDSNTVFMIYLHSPAKVWILDSEKGTGYDNVGRKLLKIGKRVAYVADNNDIVYADGKYSGYVYDGEAYAYKDGECVGDIYSGKNPIKEYGTCFLYICKSEDEGLTWSKPECLNLQVKDRYMSFIGACPGVGIKIKRGKYAGRLIFPIYFNTLRRALSLSSCVIYSDDGGATWKRGKSPNDGRRKFIFKLSSRFVSEFDMITESQVIELEDGVLRMFMRNHSLKRLIAMAESYDGGETWINYRHNPALIHPICQVSAINAVYKGKEVTLVCNAADKKRRINGTIRLSYDYGETFAFSAKVKADGFVYSSMVQADDGDILLLYEGSTEHESIDSLKFSIEEIEKGQIIYGGA